MCKDCGCAIQSQPVTIAHSLHERDRACRVDDNVVQDLLAANNKQAGLNRTRLDQAGVLAVNLMSSPGAGKTTLLTQTILRLEQRYRMAVIVGDLQTDNDARRLAASGVRAVQISTGSTCHLDADMVAGALQQLDLSQYDIVFIENVGNLVCPADFDLGQHRNVTLLSVTEGADKPEKYPSVFRVSDAVLLSKVDLLPVLDDFDPQQAIRLCRQVGCHGPVLQVTVRSQTGLSDWLQWLEQQHTVSDQRHRAG
jgi:hydrogenase nickel incorporation protein HypB